MIDSYPNINGVQTYAERAKKLNEEKDREEREGKRAEGDRIRLVPAPAPAPSPSPAPLRARQDSGGGSGGGAPGPAPGAPVRQEPLFHSVPPRPQRLLHSEAYIKYIEVRNNVTICR